MLTFTPFCEVEIRHAYFQDGLCRHLLFEPDRDTVRFLSAWGFRTCSDGSRMVIHAETSRMESIWKDRLEHGKVRELVFYVLSTDPTCLGYTDLEAALEVGPGIAEAVSSRIELKPISPKSSEDLEIKTESRFARSMHDCGARTLLAELHLPLCMGAETFNTWQEHLGCTFFLSLAVRQTIWKYLMVGDWEAAVLRMVDQAKEIDFEEPSEERLSDGSNARVIRSLQPIGFEEKPTRRFQLRDQGVKPERVLMPRMPNAKPLSLFREMVRGSPVTVSEIFINR